MPRRNPRLRPQVCQICRHPEQHRIELMRAQGVSCVAIAEKFDVDRKSIARHWDGHVSADAKTHYLAGGATVAAIREKAIEEEASVLDYLRMQRSILFGQMVACAEAGDSSRVAYLSRAHLETVQELGKLTGEIRRLNPSVTVNNVVNIFERPQFQAFLEGLLRIAREHPETKASILALVRNAEQQAEPPAMIEGTAHAA